MFKHTEQFKQLCKTKVTNTFTKFQIKKKNNCLYSYKYSVCMGLSAAVTIMCTMVKRRPASLVPACVIGF